MTAKEVRKQFLDFFASKGHQIVPSAPIVIKNDPTLLFTNAGMNQFKDAFLGHAKPLSPRVADTQKCLRVSGKHNDLEEVGHDTYHHTMFEMLGNWSFGDYFKKEAIEWAWELLVDVYKLDPERMYVTVFEGNPADGLQSDETSREHWRRFLPNERILNGSAKDNFWEMGDTGPCGPCSEIHFDLRSGKERAGISGADLVNNDHPEVIEVWNLVFMEFNRKANGDLEKLPAQHVDTGMGFERLCRIIKGAQSNYDTDVFLPLIEKQESLSGKKRGEDPSVDVAFRVVADHIRAIAFAVADGQLPSNTGAGYVIRRILRRASRYAYSVLELKSPFMFELVDVLDKEMGDFFPEIRENRTLVESVIREEENSFLRTLEQGLRRLDEMIAQTQSKEIDGERAFELYDTYGFPLDLTHLILREKGMNVDQEGFNRQMEAQKSRSRKATQLNTDDWVELSKETHSIFSGYDTLVEQARIVRYRKVDTARKSFYQVILDKTPFYAEGGGQVGDRGWLKSDGESVPVWDTRLETGQILHFVDRLPGNPKAPLEAEVDQNKRRLTANNHSATHLLHEALREVLGNHVEQKGSLVNDERLRFDFSHFQKVSREEMIQIEDFVNRRVRMNIPLEEFRNIPIDEAKAMGAMALFGEKYGNRVRAIKFGNSVELCGGTHVPATGQIGIFKIVAETAVAAGVRRIEAFTADAADQWIRGQIDTLQVIQHELKSPDSLVAIRTLKDENQRLTKEMEQLMRAKAGELKGELIGRTEVIKGVRFIAQKVDIDAAAVKDMAFQLKSEATDLFMLLALSDKDKVQLHLIISDALCKERGWNAGKLIKELAGYIKGGGGGAPFYATAGGSNPAGIEKAFEAAKSYL